MTTSESGELAEFFVSELFIEAKRLETEGIEYDVETPPAECFGLCGGH
jgi:hypothetical protein